MWPCMHMRLPPRLREPPKCSLSKIPTAKGRTNLAHSNSAPSHGSHMAMPGLTSWLLAMGMKTQMLSNYQTIVSTSKPPRCVRALLTMVGEDAGLEQCVGSSCRAQARACLTLTPNYSKGREKQPQSPLSGSHLRRRWHFSKKPHCVMMTRLNTRRGYGSATKTPALSPLPASQRELGF